MYKKSVTISKSRGIDWLGRDRCNQSYCGKEQPWTRPRGSSSNWSARYGSPLIDNCDRKKCLIEERNLSVVIITRLKYKKREDKFFVKMETKEEINKRATSLYLSQIWEVINQRKN